MDISRAGKATADGHVSKETADGHGARDGFHTSHSGPGRAPGRVGAWNTTPGPGHPGAHGRGHPGGPGQLVEGWGRGERGPDRLVAAGRVVAPAGGPGAGPARRGPGRP